MANKCIHCQEEIPAGLDADVSEGFCCSGCETVFCLIKSSNLDEYYSLYKKFSEEKRRKPNAKLTDFSFLNDPIYLAEEGFAGKNTMTFYLEGIHCVACLWLVENITKISSEVIKAKVNMALGTVEVTVSDEGKFGDVATLLEKIGYPPHPLRSESQREQLIKKENKKWLIRLGVSAALAGNVMLLSVSNYAGATEGWRDVFNYLSILLSFPVLTYGAMPFYQSALTGIKLKKLTIDVPIALAIAVGGVLSLIHVFIGSEQVYFDSLCTLVFLLLASRYLLRRMNQRSFSSKRFLTNLTPRFAWVVCEAKIKKIPTSKIQVGDTILVKQNEVIPTDGVLLNDARKIDDSTFTGESEGKAFIVGSKLFGGCKNLGEEIRMKVSHLSSESRIGKILIEVKSQHFVQTETSELTDKAAQWFVIFTIIFGAIVFFSSLSFGVQVALERFLSFIIIVCPCALALATPLSFAMGLNKALNMGIVFKSARYMELLGQVKIMFFDKTGTLTRGELVVKKVMNRGGDENLPSLIYQLEKKSEHPIGKALLKDALKNLVDKKKYQSMLVDEKTGSGPEGVFENHKYYFKSLESEKSGYNSLQILLKLGFFKDDELIAEYYLHDFVDEKVIEGVSEIQKMGVEVKILSGDRESNVNRVANIFNLNLKNQHSGKTPEEKQQIVGGHFHSAMVGDGANDALPLKEASVGIAVKGSLEVSVEAANVMLTKGGCEFAYKALVIAKEVSKIVKRNLAISLVYNLTGGTLAAFGFVTPLFAAVLMPLSSLSVVLSSVIGTKKIRSL